MEPVRQVGRYDDEPTAGRFAAMLGKLAGAFIGRRMAGRNAGMKGAALGYGTAALARRGLGPLGLALGLGWGAKKLYERQRSRRGPAVRP